MTNKQNIVRGVGAIALLVGVHSFQSEAAAQTFIKPNADDVKDVKAPKWSANAEAGALLTTGNSSNTTLSGSLKVARVTPQTKFELTASGALARNGVLVVDDAGNDKIISSSEELDTEYVTTAQSWAVKGRFDKFLSKNDSLWVAGLIGGDKPAGKELQGGGQAGYARYLKRTEQVEAIAELGYDFSYERFVTDADSLDIHSARAYFGYKNKIGSEVSLDASIEGLANVNTLDTVFGEVTAGEDLRVNGSIGMTTKLSKTASMNVTFAAKFDNQPAPLGAITGFTYAAPVEASKLDTITKISLILNLF